MATHCQCHDTPAKVREMDGMDDVEITTFLANGLNGTYVGEWNELYIGIVTLCKTNAY